MNGIVRSAIILFGSVDRAHGRHTLAIAGTACNAPHRGSGVDPDG